MPRNLTGGMIAALNSQQVKPAFFVTATFLSGPVYIWSGLGTINWNGKTWQGLGSLANISTIEEGSNVEAKNMTLSLSGIDVSMLTAILNQFQLALPAFVNLALFDDSGNIIPDPLLSFAGRMDIPTLTVSGETATIAINCESRLVDMNTPALRRFTSADQQIDYPNDLGFAWVPSLIDVSFFWGSLPGGLNNFTSQGS
jgi:hypothetical protein